MTSCVHKMCERKYGHANMKRAMTLAKINYPWNRYYMRMLRSCPTYLDWPWCEHAHIIPISWMVDFCESHIPFHVSLTICRSAHLVYATSHLSFVALWLSQKSAIREIGIICTCSDHGQPRYQLWIKCEKRQMTSCVHKMCGRTYGQTNMKRAITLTKINHPWNHISIHSF
jgi:hypothetical protein